MQGDVNKLTATYQEQMDKLFQRHAESMEAAKDTFAHAVHEATTQFQALIAQAQPAEPEPEPAQPSRQPGEQPLAVWSKTPKGDDCLILNKEAAIMQMALLDQLAEVLAEMQKMAPRKNQNPRR